MRIARKLLLIAPLAASAALVGCNDHASNATTTVITPVATSNTYGLSAVSGNVVSFDRSVPTGAKLVSNVAVSGLASGENIVGFDVRSNSATTGNTKLYVITDKNRLYTLDPSTGFVASPLALKAGTATTATNCTAPAAFSALSGTQFGVDFNPAKDRLRVVSNTGQNLAINVDDGSVTVDCPVNIASGTTPVISGAAYINTSASSSAAASTTLYYIDAGTDNLYTTASPGTGTLTLVGALGVDIGAINGFDIDGVAGNIAYLVATVGSGTESGNTFLYTIDLSNGAATAKAKFTSGEALRGLAIKI